MTKPNHNRTPLEPQALADAIQKVSLEKLKETFEQTMFKRQRALSVSTGDKAANDETILQAMRNVVRAPKVGPRMFVTNPSACASAIGQLLSLIKPVIDQS